ncbi:MAG TPA: hypothetical protein VM734_12310 [Kofleriaceae bacterium]|jgi:hypothetical protein|nr:hypothetical protein [Kofleriaceae bacterium]
MTSGGDGPYRSVGDTHLGRVVARFPIMRRPRYLGSARAVSRRSPMGPGSLIPSAGPASSPIEWTRRPSGEAVEVCERGLRLIARAGVLELLWDQLVAVERVDDPGGIAALVITGVHGEEVRLDRSLRGLAELAAAIERGRG